jgi:hypothetical protein
VALVLGDGENSNKTSSKVRATSAGSTGHMKRGQHGDENADRTRERLLSCRPNVTTVQFIIYIYIYIIV